MFYKEIISIQINIFFIEEVKI